MNTLDTIIIVIILIPTLLGLRKGLLKSIFSLAGIITGFYLATTYYDKVYTYVNFLNAEPKLTGLISFILIFLICYFTFTFIAKKISGLNAVTKTLDKAAGVVLGFAKGIILASIFLIITTNTFKLFGKDVIEKSGFYPVVINIAPEVYNFIQKFFPGAKNFYEQINKNLFTENNSIPKC